MTMGQEVVTAVMTMLGVCVAISTYLIRRWMERLETKVDQLSDGRARLMDRRDCASSVNRVHQRIDEIQGEIAEVSNRVTRMESAAGKWANHDL